MALEPARDTSSLHAQEKVGHEKPRTAEDIMYRPQQLARHQNQQIQNEIVHVTTKAQFIIKTNTHTKKI